jgi:replicative DNA helicase
MSDVGRRVIAFCLKNDDLLIQCVGELEPDCFEISESHIFGGLKQHYLKYKKCITENLLDKYLDTQNLDVNEQENILETFREIEDTEVDKREFEYYFDELKKEHTTRLWLSTLNGSVDENGKTIEGLAELAVKNPKEAYDMFKSKIGVHMEDLENKGSANCATIDETANMFWKDLGDRELHPEKSFGIKTGFNFIDEQTLGMHAGELFIIGGRPGSGKSIFLLNVAANAYKVGKNVLIISIEMPREQYEMRFYSCYCAIPFHSIQTSNLDSAQKKVIRQTLDHVIEERAKKQHYLYIADITNVTAYTIEAQIEKIITKCGFKPDILVVDYLGIMRSIDKKQADWQEQLAVAEELRRIGRVRKIPIITAVQLNRDKQHGKGTERISRSDGIGSTCDVFLQIMEKEEENSTDEKKLLEALDDTLSIFIGKCRNGEADRPFQVYRDYACMTMKNKDTYVPRVIQMADSLSDIENEELQVPQPVLTSPSPEDEKSVQKGDFIGND